MVDERLEGEVGGEVDRLTDGRLDPAHVTMLVEAVGLNEAEPIVSE